MSRAIRAPRDELDALRRRMAFVDLSEWRKVMVQGPDARVWLNDLVSAEVGSLSRGHARRSLLLSPTGRVRADVMVAVLQDGFLLVQDPTQRSSIGDLLEPYVLSSEVRVEDRTPNLSLLALVVPDEAPPPDVDGGEMYRPSSLGVGLDVVVSAAEWHRAATALGGLLEAGPAAVEAWRIERGVARLGTDLTEESLPHEAALDDAIAYGKGCFLGQEAVAKVRNLGHPPFVIRRMEAAEQVAPGEGVLADGEAAGQVTSAATLSEGRVAVLARVRWAARDRSLRTEAGVALRGLAAGP